MLYPYGLLNSKFRVFEDPRTPGQDGSDTCYLIQIRIFLFLFSLLNPTFYIINLILECLFFLMLLTGIKLRLWIQSSKKYTVLYFLKLSFYFEIQLSHRGGRQLELNLFIICLLVGPWRVIWDSVVESLIFKLSSIQRATETPSTSIYMTHSNLLAHSGFHKHMVWRTLFWVFP